MAFLDNQLLLSDAQALTASAASTNIIDLSASRNIGAGEPMAVALTIDVAADHTTGDETYSVAVEVDDDSSFGSATTIATYTLSASTVKGDVHVIGVPVTPTNADNRYLRLSYTLAGTTPSVTVTAFLTAQSLAPQTFVAFADGYTIS